MNGMTSPRRMIRTVSPMRMSRSATRRGLWSVANVTVVPPTNTGSTSRARDDAADLARPAR